MKVKRRSSFLEAWIRLRKNKLAIVCLAVVCLLILIAVFADLITPYENALDNVFKQSSSPFKGGLPASAGSPLIVLVPQGRK